MVCYPAPLILNCLMGWLKTYGPFLLVTFSISLRSKFLKSVWVYHLLIIQICGSMTRKLSSYHYFVAYGWLDCLIQARDC